MQRVLTGASGLPRREAILSQDRRFHWLSRSEELRVEVEGLLVSGAGHVNAKLSSQPNKTSQRCVRCFREERGLSNVSRPEDRQQTAEYEPRQREPSEGSDVLNRHSGDCEY